MVNWVFFPNDSLIKLENKDFQNENRFSMFAMFRSFLEKINANSRLIFKTKTEKKLSSEALKFADF